MSAAVEAPKVSRLQYLFDVKRRDAGMLTAAMVVLALSIEVLASFSMLFMLLVHEDIPFSRNADSLFWLTLLAVLATAMAAGFGYIQGHVLFIVARWLERRLYLRTLQACIRFGRQGRPALAGVVLNDFAELRRFVAGSTAANVLALLASPVHIVFMFAMHWVLGVITVVGCGIIAAVTFFAERKGQPELAAATLVVVKAKTDLFNRLRRRDEMLGLGLLPAIIRRWGPQRHAAAGLEDATERRMSALRSGCELVQLFTISAVFIYSGVAVATNELTPMGFTVCHMLVYRMTTPYTKLATDWLTAARAISSYGRMCDTLRAAEAENETVDAAITDRPGLQVDALDVVVPDSDRTLVRALGMELLPGTVCIVSGPNGTGKSTLLRTLLGLVPADSGRVYLEGQDMHRTSRIVLGPQIGLLGQRPQLLDGTILENIARFNEDVAGAVLAARAAGAHQMIGRLPQGYATPAGSASGLSGGQQRLVALARALYGNPTLVALDEPETGLDAPAKAAVVAAVRALRDRGAIVLLVTHEQALWADVATCELNLAAGGEWTLLRSIDGGTAAEGGEVALPEHA